MKGKPTKTCRRVLSVLLSVLMVLTSLPLLSVQPLAAPSTAQLKALADALKTTGVRDANWRGASSAVPMKVGSDPNASSRAYANGQAVWNAANAYYTVAQAVYADRTNSTIAASGNEGYSGTTGNYNTPNKVKNRIRALLISSGHMTEAQMTTYKTDNALRYLSGNFTATMSSGFGGTVSASQDTVTVQRTSTYYFVGSTSPAPKDRWGTTDQGDEPGYMLFTSTGYFGVQRSLKEALLDGTNVLNSVAATQTVTRRWQVNVPIGPIAQTNYNGPSFNTFFNTGTKYSARRYHHAMTATNYVAATVNNNSTVDSNLTADKDASNQLAALKKWRDVNWGAAIATMNYTQLLALRSAYDSALTTLGNTTLSGAVLSADANADVLSFYGLKSISEGSVFRSAINAQLASRLVDDYGDYFHDTHAPYGKLVSPNAAHVFNSAQADNFDPRGGYAGLDLAGLDALYTEAKTKHDTLQSYANSSAEAEVWTAILAECQARGYTMNLSAQSTWLTNVQRIIRQWKTWDKYQQVQDFLDLTADYHAGANDNLNPEDPEEPFADSEYKYNYTIINTWYSASVGDYSFLQQMHTDGFGAIVNAIFGNFETLLFNRRAELLAEKNYRQDQGYSEDKWYSYRDFFTPLMAMDFNEYSSEELMAWFKDTTAHPGPQIPRPAYKGIEPNYTQYKSMSNSAKSALGTTLWSEIYGNYAADVIEPVRASMFRVLAARLTQQVNQGMTMILNAKGAANEINISKTHPRYGSLKPLSWSTYSKLKSLVDGLYKGTPDKDIYAFLNTYSALGYLGFEGYLGLPGDTSAQVKQDYDFLNGVVMDAYNTFISNPNNYFKQTTIAPPDRPAREDDILEGHSYTDTDDAATKELIKRLDAFLGSSGDMGPALKALNVDDLIDLESLGINLDALGKVNLTSVIDEMMEKLIYNDDTVNMIIEMLFPMLLTELENIFDTMLPEEISSLNLGDMELDLVVGKIKVTKLEVRPRHLYNILGGIREAPQAEGLRISGADGIKIYPDHLGAKINAADFPQVRSALLGANGKANGHSGWTEGVGDANGTPYTSWIRAGGSTTFRKCYPTNAWTPERSPGLFDAEGKLNLQWNINGSPDRFKKALSQVFSGLWPLLKALLAGGNQTIKLNEGDVARADIAANLFNISLSDRQIDLLSMSITGLDGYSKLLVPILEMLLGPGETSIPTIAAVRAYGANGSAANSTTGSKALVDAIIDPLTTYINRLKQKPITEIIKLLPNLCYALSLDRVKPLLDDLEIKLGVKIDAQIMEITNPFGDNWRPSIADFGQAIEIPDIAFNISDMLSGPDAAFDIGSMLTMDGLMDMVFGAMGGEEGFTLPPFNAGRIASYGTIASYSSKRSPAGNRFYITANQPDVMQALLGWILGAGFFPLNLNPNGSGDIGEAVAAVLELVKPKTYTPKDVVYPQQIALAEEKFPDWWAGQGSEKARLDGDYLVANADIVLNVLWQSLIDPNQSFSEGIISRFESMGADGNLYYSIVEKIQTMVGDYLGEDGTLANMRGLLSTLTYVNGQPFDITQALDAILNYTIPPAEDVDTITELVAEMVIFLEPIVPVLDILFAGANLELIDIGDGSGRLLHALTGGNGFANALQPILEAFTKPLGLGTVDGWSGTDREKLEALLNPIHDIYYAVIDDPVESFLTLLPNLAYFMIEHDENGSPMQQCLNSLLHPLYVLLDSIRPIYGQLSLGELPNGLSFSASEGLRFDLEGLINGFLGDMVIGETPVHLVLSDFLLGEYDSTAGYFQADKTAVLFALLNSFGLLSEIERLEMTGLTKLIQYEKFPGPKPIDYSKGAPQAELNAEPPRWFRQSHADYLVDNADAVIRWAWQELINTEPSMKDFLQEKLGDTVTLGSSLADTIDNFVGSSAYVKDNIPVIIDMVLGLRGQLDSIVIPKVEFLDNQPYTLTEVLAKLVYIYDEERSDAAPIPLDLHALMAPLDDFMAAYADDPDAALAGVTDVASFKAKLVELFSPLMPLLRILLAESNALLIYSEDIQPNNQEGVPGGPGNSPADDKALLRVYGYNGYETGLMPILLGLGADIPGFTASITPYNEFRDATEAQQLEAILDPLLFLIDALAKDPVHTLLEVAPNAAYFLSDSSGKSLLNQSIANLLHPVTVLLDETGLDIGDMLDGITGLQLGNQLNDLLAEALGSVEGIEAFTLEQLVIGLITVYSETQPEANTLQLQKLGWEEKASYVESDLSALLIQLLSVTGAFDQIDKSGFAGLVELLNVDDRIIPEGPGLLDYEQAPAPAEAMELAWLGDAEAKFLVDNADQIINWAWREVVNYKNDANEMPFKTYLESLFADWGAQVTVGATLEDTVNSLLGGYLFTQDNFDMIIAALADLKGQLDSFTLAGLTLPQLLAKVAVTGNTPADIESMFSLLVKHADADDPYYVTINNADEFVQGLVDLLKPFMPLLRVFLAESDLKIIVDEDIPQSDGVLIVDGFDGYRTGLLPILLALGGSVDGFIEGDGADYAGLTTYEAFLPLDEEGQLKAIVEPILYLLNKIASDPADTLLNVVPSLLWFIGSDEGKPSLLAGAVENILHPLTVVLAYLPEGTFDLGLDIDAILADALKDLPFDLQKLTIGDVTRFGTPWNKLGLNDGASYLAADKAQLLIQILAVTGALDQLDDETLAALIGLLNINPDEVPAGAELIDYSKAPAAVEEGSMYPESGWMTKEHTQLLVDNADGVIDWAWERLIAGNPEVQALIGGDIQLKDSLTETVEGLLGNYLYTPANFELIAGELRKLKESLDDISFEGVTLAELLKIAVQVYDPEAKTFTPLDLNKIFADLDGYTANPAVTDPAVFKTELAALLEPLAPLLRVFLAENDLLAVVDEEINGKQGLVRIHGGNGYETGLLPLLLGIGANVPGFLDTITLYKDLTKLDDAAFVAAILDPILFLLNKLTADPVHTALQLLPNAAYFISGGGGESLLQQALDNILQPLTALLNKLPMLDEMIDLSILADVSGLVEEQLDFLPFSLEELIVGSVQSFSEMNAQDNSTFTAYAALDALGKPVLGAQYVQADQADLLAQILKLAGAYEIIEREGFTGLLNLLNITEPEGPQRIDYSKAPAAVNPKGIYPSWFKRTHAQFLVDNVDGVLNWAWRRLLYQNEPAKQELSDTIGIKLEDTLEDTLQGLLGSTLYTQSNFENIVAEVLKLKAQLDGVEILGVKLTELLKDTVYINDTALDLDAIFAPFENFSDFDEVTDEATFMAALKGLLTPMVPLLRVLLFDDDAVIIKDDRINSGNGFLRLYGNDAYRTGVMPLLLGLGADVPGFTVMAYEEVVTDEDVIDAIVQPLLYLLNELAQNPINTLMKLLPNAAYFISDAKGPSLLQQAIDNILYPVNTILASINLPGGTSVLPEMITDIRAGDLINAELAKLLDGKISLKLEDLVVGDETLLPDPLNELGLDDKGSFIKVDDADLLAQLLKVLGAYDLLQGGEYNLTGLVNLLNYTGREKEQLTPLVYPSYTASTNALYRNWLWKRKEAKGLASRMNTFLDDFWMLITGQRFGAVPLEGGGDSVADTFVSGLLGDALYTQDNFDALVNALKGALAGIDLSQEIVKDRSIADLLDGVVKIDGVAIDIPDVLAKLQAWKPSGPVNTAAGFKAQLVSFLAPVTPLLDWLLFGKDLTVLKDEPGITEGGLLVAYGHEGYRYGIIPIYEALLKPMGAQSKISPYSEFNSPMTNEQKLDKILAPLFYAMEQLATNPLDTILAILPNLAYFTVDNANGKSLFEESVEKALFALTNVLGNVMGAKGNIFEILGFDLNITRLLDSMLKPLGINGLDGSIVKRFLVGSQDPYTSLSGYGARYQWLKTDDDKADLLTAILRLAYDLVQRDKANREKLVTALTELIRPSGIGKTSVHWGLHLILWRWRWFNITEDHALRRLFVTVKVLQFFMPVFNWFKQVFGGLFGWT